MTYKIVIVIDPIFGVAYIAFHRIGQGFNRIILAAGCVLGGGDGFASGFFYGLITGRTPEEAVKLGWAHGDLLTTTPEDTTMVTLEQVENFIKGSRGRIQR